MKANAFAIWQKYAVPFVVAMQRTQRTYVRTNERLQDTHKYPRVSYLSNPVDNRVSGRFEVVF